MDQWPDHLALLDRFRDWLYLTREEFERLDEPEPPARDRVGLYQLVEQLTALRHDAKLLTKASRGSEERMEAAILSMQAAIEQMRSVEPREAAVAEESVRPFIQALIELDESFTRARLVIERTRQRVLDDLQEAIETTRCRMDELYASQSWWRRMLCGGWHRQARELYSADVAERSRDVFDSLLEGFDLIGNRLRRAMQQQSIARIECVGRQVDPDSMSVVEVVCDENRPAGAVIEEVRPGYLWNDAVFRFAEVKAVQSTCHGTSTSSPQSADVEFRSTYS